ncbi:gspb 2 secretion system [Caudoviricetes sp.]|nr:gspb 2 secretion system [Caudoviricetes sp.]
MILDRNIVIDGQTYFAGERLPANFTFTVLDIQYPLTHQTQCTRAMPIDSLSNPGEIGVYKPI